MSIIYGSEEYVREDIEQFIKLVDEERLIRR